MLGKRFSSTIVTVTLLKTEMWLPLEAAHKSLQLRFEPHMSCNSCFQLRIELRLRWFQEEQFNKTITAKMRPMLHGPANEFLLLFHLWAGIFNNCDPDVSLLRTRLVKCQGKCKLISNRPMDASDLFDSCLLCFMCWSRQIPDPDVKSSASTHRGLAKFYIHSEPVKQNNYIQKIVTNKR